MYLSQEELVEEEALYPEEEVLDFDLDLDLGPGSKTSLGFSPHPQTPPSFAVKRLLKFHLDITWWRSWWWCGGGGLGFAYSMYVNDWVIYPQKMVDFQICKGIITLIREWGLTVLGCGCKI